jgi:hypothetical protein
MERVDDEHHSGNTMQAASKKRTQITAASMCQCDALDHDGVTASHLQFFEHDVECALSTTASMAASMSTVQRGRSARCTGTPRSPLR